MRRARLTRAPRARDPPAHLRPYSPPPPPPRCARACRQGEVISDVQPRFWAELKDYARAHQGRYLKCKTEIQLTLVQWEADLETYAYTSVYDMEQSFKRLQVRARRRRRGGQLGCSHPACRAAARASGGARRAGQTPASPLSRAPRDTRR